MARFIAIALLAAACGGSVTSVANPTPAPSTNVNPPPPADPPPPPANLPVALPAPPAPVKDNPAECVTRTTPPPDLTPHPDRPCTSTDGTETTTYDYDASGRLVLEQHAVGGFESGYRLEESGDTRVETFFFNGALQEKRVTTLKRGQPIAADWFSIWVGGSEGPLSLDRHLDWAYDAAGRETSITTRSPSGAVTSVHRSFYDDKGRLYFSDDASLDGARIYQYRPHLRSWFANGTLASDASWVAGDPNGFSRFERHWDACGSLTQDIAISINGRWSGSTGYSWNASGALATRHEEYSEATAGWVADEQYTTDGAGRVISSILKTTPPPNVYATLTTQSANYVYDAAGRLNDRLLDGVADFHARYDDEGRLTELGARFPTRFSYEGCNR